MYSDVLALNINTVRLFFKGIVMAVYNQFGAGDQRQLELPPSDNKYFPLTRGVPQGAVCSPVMANIFLHYLVDLWMETIVKRKAKGYAAVVRYADDFIIFAEMKKEADKILRRLKGNLQKFGLELSMEKTSFIPFGKNTFEGKNNDNTFDFLGFTFFNDRSSDGTYKIGKQPIKKSRGNHGELPLQIR